MNNGNNNQLWICIKFFMIIIRNNNFLVLHLMDLLKSRSRDSTGSAHFVPMRKTDFLIRRAGATKAPLRVQFLLTFLGEGGGKSKKLRLRGREGSIESQQSLTFLL